MEIKDITHKEIEEVKRIAAEAGKILIDKSKNIGKVIHKDNGAGLLTEADEASETYILESLSQSFPGTFFLSEEAGLSKELEKDEQLAQKRDSGLWIIDPLDGTNNYAHGFPWYCVSIGLELQGELCLGVIYHPVLKEMFSAVKGQGAFLNEEKISVSNVGKLEEALLTVGFYYYKDDVLNQEIKRFERVHQKVLGIRRPGSAALDMAYVAAGRMDGFWEKGLNPWDMAAGKVIAEEAGAVITNYKGEPFSLYKAELLMTNGKIHDKLIPLLQHP